MTLRESRLELSDVVDLSHLQAVHDVFSDDMKSRGIQVASAILDAKAVPLTFEFNHCAFCREIRRTKLGMQLCRASDLKGMELAREELRRTGRAKPVFYVCRQGLVDFCAPIIVEQDIEGQKKETIVAYFFGGQFRYAGKWNDAELRTPEEPAIDILIKSADWARETLASSHELTRTFGETEYLDRIKFDQLETGATGFANILNGMVQKLHDWHRVRRLEDFMEGVAKVRTVDDLFDLVIESLPRMIHAGHCSIFTVQRDEPSGREHLVLRRTSYSNLKRLENSAYYDKGEGLTGWVWEHARSLRLENLQDLSELMAHGGLKWAHKYDDSDDHKGFLCVPMFGRKREVIGVIRVPHKEPGNFDKYDEIFLNFLAGHLSSVIECQAAEERFDRVSGAEGLVDVAARLGRARSYSKVLDGTITGSLALFGGDGKKHFLNILESDSRHWRVERDGGTLGLSKGFEDVRGMRFEIVEGLTGLAIREHRCYISSDLEGSERSGHYIPAVDTGESAMSAPLKWGKEVYGAISVVSSKKFEFSRTKDLTILARLAELSASAIRKARIREARIMEARTKRAKARQTSVRRMGRLISRLVNWFVKAFGGTS